MRAGLSGGLLIASCISNSDYGLFLEIKLQPRMRHLLHDLVSIN